MCRSKQTPLRRGFLFQGNANELRTVRPDPHHPGVLSRVLWAGVIMRSIWICALLIAALVPGLAGAEEFFWRANYAGGIPKPTPLESCKAANSNVSYVSKVDDTRYNCHQYNGPVLF